MKIEETSRFPFCPEMRCLLAHLPDAKRLGSIALLLHSAFCLLHFQKVACKVLDLIAMSLREISDNTASPPQPNGGESHQTDCHRHISATLAHELNNLLTVVQGHADRLFVKHQEDSVLAPNLKKISEAAHRAAELVRNAPRFELDPPTV
jgi:signal transduction histidine kinase